MKRIFFFIYPCLFFLGCQTNNHDIDLERDAIINASKAFSQAYLDGNLEDQMSYYTDDIVNISRGNPLIIGKESVSNYWRLPESVKIPEHASIPQEIEIIGKMAKDYGQYKGKRIRNNDTISFSGNYLITWRKCDDGLWRMSADMWSPKNN